MESLDEGVIPARIHVLLDVKLDLVAGITSQSFNDLLNLVVFNVLLNLLLERQVRNLSLLPRQNTIHARCEIIRRSLLPFGCDRIVSQLHQPGWAHFVVETAGFWTLLAALLRQVGFQLITLHAETYVHLL